MKAQAWDFLNGDGRGALFSLLRNFGPPNRQPGLRSPLLGLPFIPSPAPKKLASKHHHAYAPHPTLDSQAKAVALFTLARFSRPDRGAWLGRVAALWPYAAVLCLLAAPLLLMLVLLLVLAPQLGSGLSTAPDRLQQLQLGLAGNTSSDFTSGGDAGGGSAQVQDRGSSEEARALRGHTPYSGGFSSLTWQPF